MARRKMAAAKQSSEKPRAKKDRGRDSRRSIRRSIRKLRAEMEEIRSEVELIRLMVGIKQTGSRKQQKSLHFKQFDKQLRREKRTLQTMEAKAAQVRAATSRMIEEGAALLEAMEDKNGELELLRMLHIHLFDEMVHLSEAEEEVMEILLS